MRKGNRAVVHGLHQEALSRIHLHDRGWLAHRRDCFLSLEWEHFDLVRSIFLVHYGSCLCLLVPRARHRVMKTVSHMLVQARDLSLVVRPLHLENDFNRHTTLLALPDFIRHDLRPLLHINCLLLPFVLLFAVSALDGLLDKLLLLLLQVLLVLCILAHFLRVLLLGSLPLIHTLEVAGGGLGPVEAASLGRHRDFPSLVGRRNPLVTTLKL